METQHAINALASLAQETRLAVFRLLVKAGPQGLAAGEIAEALEVPAPTLSFHLRHLTHAGLLVSRRESRSIVYSVQFDGVQALLAFLTEDCCQGMQTPCEPGECTPGECAPGECGPVRGGKSAAI